MVLLSVPPFFELDRSAKKLFYHQTTFTGPAEVWKTKVSGEKLDFILTHYKKLDCLAVGKEHSGHGLFL